MGVGGVAAERFGTEKSADTDGKRAGTYEFSYRRRARTRRNRRSGYYYYRPPFVINNAASYRPKSVGVVDVQRRVARIKHI